MSGTVVANTLRIARGAVVLALAAVALLAIGRTALGMSALVAGDALRAARIDPGLSIAFVQQARPQNGPPPPPGRQVTLGRHAIALAPLNPAAFGILAEALDAPGTTASRDAALRALRPLGWRDGGAQYQLLRAAYRFQDWPELVLRADALLRQGEAEAEVLTLLQQLESVPAVRTALVERLALMPTWRGAFLKGSNDMPAADAQARADTLVRLAQSAAPPSRRERNAFLSAAIAAGQFGTAKALHDRLTGMEADDSSRRTDVREEDAGPFDWALSPVRGADVLIEQNAAGNAPWVRIAADGSAQGLLLRRTVLAAPGDRTLTLQVRGAARALTWRIRCLNGTSIPTEPQTASASADLVIRRQRFRVPVDCPAQVVEIYLDNAFGERLELTIERIEIG